MGKFMGRYTPEQTYKIMSAVHSKDTDIEVKLRKALWDKGYRYRKNISALPGTPDIVLPSICLLFSVIRNFGTARIGRY
ncbi:MAG: very short patch repair endonuclease [Muribaculum sp.]|nr:very short patch repair endonuclease [Muribaculum sp.]